MTQEYDWISRFSMPDEELVQTLVAEGRRVGKIPWCADSSAEYAAAFKLRKLGIRKQETMEETIARRG